MTARSATRPALVIAAHPADEVLGCGAVIARKRATGTPVDVLIVTDGRHLAGSRLQTPREVAARLREEAAAAAAMVGVDGDCLHLAGYEAGTLWRCEDALAAAIGKLLVELDPSEVFVPAAAEQDEDRCAVRRALCRSLVDSGSSARLVSYGVDSWSDPPARARPLPGEVEAVRCERFRYLKQAALDAYASRTRNLTGELAWRALPDRQVELLTSPTEVFLTSPWGPGEPIVSAVPVVDTVPGPVEVRVDELPTHDDRIDLRGADRGLLDRGLVGGLLDRSVVEEVVDRFEPSLDHDRAASRGRVVGTAATSGAPRLGVDAEQTISLHDSRLRLDPLRAPGWGRQGVAYGPFRRRSGLAFVARVLSSHHNAHTDPPPRGPRSVLEEVRKHGSPRPLVRPVLDDNLLVGFHDAAVPADAAQAGSSFVLHAAGDVNGELRARVGGRSARLHLGVHEVPITYVVVLREHGALYYVAGPPGAAGLGPWPDLRPVAVDHLDASRFVFAGIHQAVHAEGGHEMATSVDEVRVRDVERWRPWHGDALGADTLTGHGPLGGTAADVGGWWTVVEGDLLRNDGGVAAVEHSAEALLGLPVPAGLVHVRIRTEPVFAETGWAGLRWRSGADGRDGWRVRVWSDRAVLEVAAGGSWEVVAEGAAHLPAASVSSLQVVDDGATIGVHLDGCLLFDRWIVDERHAGLTHVGVAVGPGDRATLRAFEAHPRSVAVPAELDLGTPWDAQGDVVTVADDFAGPAGELDGAERPTPTTGHSAAWQRSLGPGRLELTGAGSLRVRADRHRPNPGRTLYTVAWDDPGFADLEVGLLPPGTARSQGQGSRGGLVVWQDDGNYVLVNVWVDDSPDHDGSAVSLFCRAGGHEREANAVWVNVGRQVAWGRRSTLRVASDGDHLAVRLDGQPVLYRRVRDLYPRATPLSISRVGVGVNREWGDDTGTELFDFRARRRR